MQLSKEQQEKLTLAIQAALGIMIIGLSAYNSAKTQSAQMKRTARKSAKQLAGTQKKEYRLQRKLNREKYRSKIQNEKLRRAAKARYIQPIVKKH